MIGKAEIGAHGCEWIAGTEAAGATLAADYKIVISENWHVEASDECA